jgi:hypothetical protein
MIFVDGCGGQGCRSPSGVQIPRFWPRIGPESRPGIRGFLQVSMGSYKCPWALTSVRGLLQVSMGSYKCPWALTSVRGLLQVSVGSYKCPSALTSVHRLLQVSMGSYRSPLAHRGARTRRACWISISREKPEKSRLIPKRVPMTQVALNGQERQMMTARIRLMRPSSRSQ